MGRLYARVRWYNTEVLGKKRRILASLRYRPIGLTSQEELSGALPDLDSVLGTSGPGRSTERPGPEACFGALGAPKSWET
jgi:hypothetical protein